MTLREKIEWIRAWASSQPDIRRCSMLLDVCDAAAQNIESPLYVHGSISTTYGDGRNPSTWETISTSPKREIGYREIICTDGTAIKVDAEDYPILARHNWYLNYSAERPYAITKMKTDQSKIWRCIFMHHLIMGTTTCVDHLDNDPLNNQKSNLRKATRQQNNINKPKAHTKLGKQTSSKYKGVHKYAHNGKFRVCIGHNRKVIQLGTFDDEDDAARAYNAKAKELFGEYAWLNPVPPKSDSIEGGK